MADPPRYPDSEGDTGVGPGRGSTTGIPRWVRLSVIVAAVLVLLVVIVMLTGGGGEHGPGRHALSGGGPGGQPLPSIVTEGSHTARAVG